MTYVYLYRIRLQGLSVSLVLIAIVFIATLGYLAQTTGLCLVRGVNEALGGKPNFLLAIVFSGSLSWIALLAAEAAQIPSPFSSTPVSFQSLIGGFLFGLGAAFNNGCGVSTISKLARGQLVMSATVIGWVISWIALTNTMTATPTVTTQLPVFTHLSVLLVITFGVLLWIVRRQRSQQKLWLSMLAIGLMGSIVFLFEPRWTPSGLLHGMSLAIWQGNHNHWPSPQRFLLIAALVGGMLLAACITKSFRVNVGHGPEYRKHLLAGILMGIGAVVAGGGNDTQLLLALPALSPAGVMAVTSMLLGIYIGKRLPR